MLKEYFRRIKRILQYAWYVIKYADHDWDYYYLLHLMAMKLEWMEKTIRNGNLVNSKKYADSIKLARCLISRIKADKYTWMYWEHYHDKIIWTDVFRGNKKMGVKIDQSHAWELKTNIPCVFKFGHEPVNQKTDLNYLCKILQKRLFNWWD